LHHHRSVRLNGHNYELAERQGRKTWRTLRCRHKRGGTRLVRPHLDGHLIPHRDHLSRAARRGAAANPIQALASVVGHVDEHGETDRQNASNSLILASEG
jgi:hypothetical protein